MVMSLTLIFGMAPPPRRLDCALGSTIGAETTDHPYATSSGIPGVLPPLRCGCKVDHSVNILGRYRREVRDLEAFDRHSDSWARQTEPARAHSTTLKWSSQVGSYDVPEADGRYIPLMNFARRIAC